MTDQKTQKTVSAVASLLSGEALGNFDLDIDEMCEQTSSAQHQNKPEKPSRNHLLSAVKELSEDSKEPNLNNKVYLTKIPCTDISPWRYSDRPENEMGDINDLADSIKQHGQQSAALARKKDGRYELIFGHRRWRACKQLGIDLLCKVVSDLTDEVAAALQTSENLDRQDISDYARAISFKRLLENRVFESESRLSEKLRVSKTTLNDILSYTRLPQDVSEQLTNIHKISRRTIVKLSVLLKDNNNRKYIDLMLEKINSGEITSSNIEKELLKQKVNTSTRKIESSVADILDVKIKRNRDGSVKFTVDVPKKLVPTSVDKVREDIKKMFS